MVISGKVIHVPRHCHWRARPRDPKKPDTPAPLIPYLNESPFDIRFACIFALGRRGDPTAVEPLEALLKTGQLSIGVPHAMEDLIEQLKSQGAPQKGPSSADQKNGDAAAASNNNQEVLDRLDHL